MNDSNVCAAGLGSADSAFLSQIRLDDRAIIGGSTSRPGGADTPPATAPGSEVRMPEDRTDDTRSPYAQMAEEAAQRALDNIRANEDAGSDLSLAALAWDAVMGLASPDQLAELDEYLTDDAGECICPPDLVERGGFKSGCPVHA